VQFNIMLINMIFAMVTGYLVIIVLGFFEIKINFHRLPLFILIFGFINGMLSSITSSLGMVIATIRPLFIMCISILLIKFLLKIKLSISALSFLLVFVGFGVGNALAGWIIILFNKDTTVNQLISDPFLFTLTNIITVIISVAIIFLIRSMYGFLMLIKDSKELIFALIFMCIILSANAGLYYYVGVYNSTAFLAIIIMSLIYSAYVFFNSFILYKNELKKAEQEQQVFYNKSLEGTLFNLRRFRHDWGNNLAVINTMLKMNKYEEAKIYLHEIIEYNTTSNSTLLYNIKNAGLFGIISSKQGLAIDKGIDIEIKGIGEICDIPGIKISELCEIVGIFLDNALEESEKLKEPVELNYAGFPKTIEISVRNKCENDIDLNQFGKESNKGIDRGNGLKIIEQILSKYKHIKNLRSYEVESKTFEQLLIIEKGL
jgi:two-component system, LytTR family, sensor histidine kinase AgrC